eukprot:9497251-Pyramimonas_sp.AAC.1
MESRLTGIHKLVIAIQSGDRGEVTKVLKQDSPDLSTLLAGKSPAHYAVEKGQGEILRILVEQDELTCAGGRAHVALGPAQVVAPRLLGVKNAAGRTPVQEAELASMAVLLGNTIIALGGVLSPQWAVMHRGAAGDAERMLERSLQA